MSPPSDRELMLMILNRFDAFESEQKAFNTRIENRFDAFESEQKAFNARVLTELGQLNTEVAEFNGKLNRIEAEVSEFNSKFNRIEAEVAEFNGKLNRIEAEVAQLNGKFNRIEAEVSEFNSKLNRIEAQVGYLRGYALEQYVSDHVNDVLAAHGYSLLKTVERTERELFYQQVESEFPVADIGRSNLDSFYRADLTLLVEKNETKAISYLTIEISNSPDEEDIARAERNADYFTRFTGVSGVAAIVGPDIHPSVIDHAKGRSVLCYVVDSNFLHNGR